MGVSNRNEVRGSKQQGVATLELALLLPIILILCTMAVEMGRVYWIHGSLQVIARAGAQAMSRAETSGFGSTMSEVEQQMRLDLGQAGVANNSSLQIQMNCLDSSFMLLGSSSWCAPGATAPADTALSYVQTQVTLSVPAPGSWMPFYTLVSDSSQILLTGQENYPYEP